jgi:hypothetical protein
VKPDYQKGGLSIDVVEFVSSAIKLLNTLPRDLNTNDVNIEIDEVPVKWYGEIIGFICVSEITGDYDYFQVEDEVDTPSKSVVE